VHLTLIQVIFGFIKKKGPGAIAEELAFQFAPATDIFVQEVYNEIVTKVSRCMLSAESKLEPARLGVNTTLVHNVSRNRRSSRSRHVNSTSIDPQLGVIRIDSLSGNPIAT
jgi:hypothetical protein